MAVFCQSCGTSLPNAARFCSSCGATIPVAPVAPGRPMVRPRMGRAIAGVCAALAQNYHWDVSVVRILAVLAFILSSGLIGVAYVAAWIGIPEEPLALPGAAGSYPPGTGA
ncbi:MAG TPA: PspC domain-containing protein [Terracidiphilus sp.]|nr:PspC domain-containing protein [Terracidiphilus sp.]